MVIWNPYTPGYFDNPYAHLKECRDTNPVQRGVHREWVLLKHKHVRQVLKSDQYDVSDLSGYFASKEKIIFGEQTCPFLAKGTQRWIMYLNGAGHLETSNLADLALRKIDFTSLIRESVDRCMPDFEHRNTFNLADLAAAIPFYLSKKMLGFGEHISFEQLHHFSHKLAVSQDVFLTKKEYREVNTAFVWAFAEFERMLLPGGLENRQTLAGFLPEISETLQQPFTSDELRSLLSVLFMASYETTKDSLGIILGELIRRPDLMQYIIEADERSIKILTEELLRVACPLQYTVRISKEELTLDGITIPAGSKLFLSLASANRDEEVFDQPDDIIPDRGDNPQLAFGGGMHACLGARVARQEVRAWLKPLCKLLVNYETGPGETPVFQRTIFMRGLRQLNLVRKN